MSRNKERKYENTYSNTGMSTMSNSTSSAGNLLVFIFCLKRLKRSLDLFSYFLIEFNTIQEKEVFCYVKTCLKFTPF